ncbi:MAG TPA: ATP-grasp domain-containing protein [Acidimicrobiales bacterium]|nr:ATP-grasp domain-containing protein [Acidimicrobiales bacterium]
MSSDSLPPQVVMVTGAGGPAGVSVIQALRRAGHRTVGVDASPEAVGIRLADAGGTLPRADEPGFGTALCDLAQKHSVTAVIPSVAEELVTLAGAASDLDRAGIAHWFPEPGAVVSCTDKWLFHQAITAAGLPGPPTALGTADGVPGPWVVKPRHGRGSRDIHLTDDRASIPRIVAEVPDAMVQHCLTGREFTIDALVDHDGVLVAAVPRWRSETKAGISVRGETFGHDALVEGVGALMGALGLTGPANIQGFIPETGPFAFTEVNPRFSGGLPLSLGAGAELVEQYLRGMLGYPLQPDRLGYRVGVRMYRYFEEIIEEPGRAS